MPGCGQLPCVQTGRLYLGLRRSPGVGHTCGALARSRFAHVHVCARPRPAAHPCLPQAATFLVTAQRGSRTVSLQAPCSFGVAGRYARLVALLAKEKWVVKSGGLPAKAIPTWHGCMPKDVQAAELRFVRDELSPVRARLSPIPEKVRS